MCHPKILLKCRFWFCWSKMGLELCISCELPCDADAIGTRSMLWVPKPAHWVVPSWASRCIPRPNVQIGRGEFSQMKEHMQNWEWSTHHRITHQHIRVWAERGGSWDKTWANWLSGLEGTLRVTWSKHPTDVLILPYPCQVISSLWVKELSVPSGTKRILR